MCSLELFEFNYYESSWEDINLGNDAYQVIFNSSLIQSHVDQDSQYGQGLKKIDLGWITGFLSNQLLIFAVPKNSGVEPGYLGCQNEYLF